jgi:hypothetical protein
MNTRVSYNNYNIDKEINYLNHKFYDATKHLGYKNVSGTTLHEYQVDYAYKINKLQYAPAYVIHKIISNIHTFINDIRT